ncbi:MAG TPA: hypothetical protein VEK31_04070 [Xanthobacteraceae bacterium]|nr:hypothetical protein [Xanthobacteraceae bacterium]
MSDKVFCRKCGELIAGEAPDAKLPCPNCGSTSRAYSMKPDAVLFSLSGLEVDATVTTYPQKLLGLARKFIDEVEEFALAIVVAHMACDIATERTCSEAFAAKGISDLEDAVKGFFNAYTLNSERIQNLYTALTADEIEKAPFWGKFKASAKRRNKIVHSSATVTKTEAEESTASRSGFSGAFKEMTSLSRPISAHRAFVPQRYQNSRVGWETHIADTSSLVYFD